MICSTVVDFARSPVFLIETSIEVEYVSTGLLAKSTTQIETSGEVHYGGTI